MSNKLNRGFYLGFRGAALLAASLMISAANTQAQAQSAAGGSSADPPEAGMTAPSGSAPAEAGTTAPSGSAPAQAAAPQASAAPAPDANSTAGDTSSSPSNVAVPAGVLWTDPKYAVKEVPARVPVPKPNQPTTGTKSGSAPAHTAPAVQSTAYDQKEANDFASSAAMPQYLWNRQDTATKGKKGAAVNTVKEMADYNKTLVEKFVSNMSEPTSATLVESNAQYLYLVSFTIDKEGKIINISSEKSYGPFTALNLSDDGENATMTAAITRALAKCSPVKVPPAGIAPWYMLLKYEPNTGKVFVANLNSI